MRHLFNIVAKRTNLERASRSYCQFQVESDSAQEGSMQVLYSTWLQSTKQVFLIMYSYIESTAMKKSSRKAS